MSKIVVSTNYNDLKALNRALEKWEGFNLFIAHPTVTPNGNRVLVKPIVCWCSDNNGYFKIYNSPDPELIQNTDLILIQDNLLDIELPQEIKNAITNDDYFLAHATSLQRLPGHWDIFQRFDPSHRAEGHHDPDGVGGFSYHRCVAQILTDSQIAPDQKAAAIIARIWPKKAVVRAARLYWLQVYFDRNPEPDEACPDVFKAIQVLENDFQEMKNYNRGTKNWEKAYRKLSDDSYTLL